MSVVLSSMRASLHQPSSRLIPYVEPIPIREGAERAWRDGGYSLSDRIPLVRRSAAVKGIQIDPAHGRRATALGDLQSPVQHRRKARPCRAKSRVDAARAPF